MRRARGRGFTLIEVLIVVVIMAVLAAVVIPLFTDTSRDAKESTLKHNMHSLVSQIGLYRMDHLERNPTIQDNDLPQLTHATDRSGKIGAAGPAFPCGPYIVGELPRNPFDRSNKVTAVAVPGQKPTAAVGALGGWLYDESTGSVWPNHAEHYK